ncbi:hypothetical protein H4Q26_007490 [Puccinia striiformis f. sp. tritici PST-130]|nr:hypothetical protein H4Q26_007490 [Puccinia striiformis f. sp. tritici PST-130]
MSPDPSLLDHLGFKFPSRKHRKGHRSSNKKTKHSASKKPSSPKSHPNPPTIGQEDLLPPPTVEDRSSNLFERPNVNILADMQESLQAAGISLQPRQVTFKRFNVTYDFSDFPPSPTRSVEMDPGESSYCQSLAWPMVPDCSFVPSSGFVDHLCCFCDEILPENPSATFLKANKKLRALPEVRARKKSKNPSALYLPVSLRDFIYFIGGGTVLMSCTLQFPQRAEHCQLHQAELATIPDGINRGWPTQIDFGKLFSRIKSYETYLKGISSRQVPSVFLDQALDQYRVLGVHKARGFENQFATFQVEQPGYYGPQGYQHIMQALNDLFKPSAAVQLAPPLNHEFFLRKVLVPEVARCLIAEDLGVSVSNESVMCVLEESRLFGEIVFPIPDGE